MGRDRGNDDTPHGGGADRRWQAGDPAADGAGWLNAGRPRPAELRRPWFMSGDLGTPWFTDELEPD